MTKKDTKLLRSLEAAAHARAEKLMEDHRGVFDAQASHDLLLRSMVMDDLASVCAAACADVIRANWVAQKRGKP